jgi:ABC-type Fe3+ transport system substrate-binding protein
VLGSVENIALPCDSKWPVLNRRVMIGKQFIHFIHSPFRFSALAAVASLLLSGCNSSSTAPESAGGAANAPEADTLVIVSPHGLEIQGEFERLWAKTHPDKHLKWIDKGGSSDDLRFVQSQFKGKGATEGIGVDCYFGGGAETFLDLEKSNSLQKLPSAYGVPEKLNGMPLRGAKNHWVAAALSEFGILYNKNLAARDKLPIPATWADLSNPKLRGRIELADPRHSGSAHATYEIILQTNGWKNGWKILTGMAANSRRFVRGASDLPKDVSSGEAVFATAIDFYARGAIDRAGSDKLGYVSPRGQGVVTPDPIGILRGAPSPKLAREWVQFVMSPAAQKLWMYKKGAPGGPTQNSLFRQSALPSLYKPISASSLILADPYAVQAASQYDADKAAARRRVIDDLIGATLVENQPDIAKWWASQSDPNRLNFVPVEESEVQKAAASWDDAAFRDGKLKEWGAKAAKYFGG